MTQQPTTGFAVFKWFSEDLLAALSDRKAFFMSEWMTEVELKGGTHPQFSEATEATDEALWLSGMTPQPGKRLFRLYGHAVAPPGVERSFEMDGDDDES